jgi:MurNAc alpha-1-phosphate uridylyltransferase
MRNNITQAFIMAAGRGSRMRPLTDTIPKPLAKINNRPLIDYIVEKLSALSGVQIIIVNTHYLPDILESHLKSLNNPKIIISSEKEKLETGGGLIKALPLIDDEAPILIINSDILWKDAKVLDLMIETFDEKKMDILLGLQHKDHFFGYEGNGDFAFNKISGELSKPEDSELNYVFCGIQILHPRILKNRPKEKQFSLNYYYQKALRDNGSLDRICGVELQKESIFHIGTMDSLKKANDLFKEP